MVNYGTDLVVMGGFSNGSYSSSFYQLSVENGIFKWEKMKPELKIPREDFVSMTMTIWLHRTPLDSSRYDVTIAVVHCQKSNQLSVIQQQQQD